MTNKLISLVLLVFFLTSSYSYSEDQFIFPKKKPSVFKKIEINIESENSKNLPQKKPVIQAEDLKNEILKKKKVEDEKIEIKKNEPSIEKEEKIKKISVFLLPQKY